MVEQEIMLHKTYTDEGDNHNSLCDKIKVMKMCSWNLSMIEKPHIWNHLESTGIFLRKTENVE